MRIINWSYPILTTLRSGSWMLAKAVTAIGRAAVYARLDLADVGTRRKEITANSRPDDQVPIHLAAMIARRHWPWSRDENEASARNVANASSSASLGLLPRIGLGAYSTSKAALNMLSCHLVEELGQVGMPVKVLTPTTFSSLIPTSAVSDAVVDLDQSGLTGCLVALNETDRVVMDGPENGPYARKDHWPVRLGTVKLGSRWGNVMITDACVMNGVSEFACDWKNEAVVLRLLGGFELRVASALALLPLTAARLVAFVALREGPTPRQFAAQSLWTQGTDGRAAGCLRSALWRVRLLGAPLIITHGDYLYVAPGVRVDVHQARSFAVALAGKRASFDPATARRLLATDVLPHWYDDWLLLEQEQFRVLRLHALEIAAVGLAESGRYLEALDIGLSAVTADPLRESAHRAVMRIHLMEGNYSEALREFNTYAEIARRDLGVEPSPQIEKLLDQAQRGTRFRPAGSLPSSQVIGSSHGREW